MKKVLIIGAAGFVGGYLIDHIQKNRDWNIIATKLPGEKIENREITVIDLNILDIYAVSELISTSNPDYIFHLAAQSSVAFSWKHPDITVDVNIKGTLNLLDSIYKNGSHPKVLLIGSGEEYGYVFERDLPIKEETYLRPSNIYAATKAFQNMLGNIYSKAYSLNIINVRAFNHIGPKQSPTFVISDFCKQIVLIEQNKQRAVIQVGNINVKRDFTDVRDIVRAYVMLMDSGKNGATYNVGSGRSYSIKYILNHLLKLTDMNIKVQRDVEKYRPTDVTCIEADINKIRCDIGWEPQISLDITLKNTLDYWRNMLGDMDFENHS